MHHRLFHHRPLRARAAVRRVAGGVGDLPMTERRAPYGLRRIFELTVEGNPIPKGRPRVVDGHAYTPQATRDYEALVRDAAAIEWAGEPMMKGPLSIHLTFHRGDRRHVDYDNLAKSITDALQGIVYRNDSQIFSALITKRIGCDSPRAEIAVIPR